MSFDLIEIPRRLCPARRFLITEQADQCVNWLKANGFDVLSIEPGPSITIRTSPLCNELEGAVAGYSRGLHGERRYKMVIRFDCAVYWLDEGVMQ